ncbi:ATP-binding protein [Actinomycetospora endophytica]|uniref:ATP-binding protein n=1 Tax=Actinomycetospora endophytica TaxID=2291215 RepID=A0ABS8PIX3_9PSEU|nr:ATP-binding protein [Actinomycetospora endophytica]MCD2198218.1 ATP-binding protein [Actinomycetospora endophytica]
MQKLAWEVRPAPPSGGAVVASVRGDLDRANRAALVASLAELLGEHRGVVLDVSELRPGQSSAVHAFTDALARAGGWPRACLALVAPGPELAALLTSSRVADEAPVYADVTEALARLADRPDVLRDGWRFDVDPHAPGRARSQVRELCRRWGLGREVREAAEIVVTELVTNAVEHALSPSVVEIERHGDAFRMAVRDYGSGADHVVPEATSWHAPPTSSPRGRGLAMVAAVSRTWGVLRHPDGKTIWAEMAA